MAKKSKIYGRRYDDKEKKKIVKKFIESGYSKSQFCIEEDIAMSTLNKWLQLFNATGKHIKHGQYSPEQRRQAVEEFMRSGMTQKDFAKVWGVDTSTLSLWLRKYRDEGPKALEPGRIYGKGLKRGRKAISESIKNEIIARQKSLPTFGLKKLQNFMQRFDGIKVSHNTIKKVLKEAEEFNPKLAQPKKRKPPQIRRFERARPMQMWQTDITSYVIPRSGNRVYLVVFLDDHSRYIVSWAMALKQTGEFVIKCLVDGMEKFGKPEEVLSDQGRQYFSWRGRSEFQRLLEREGVQHVVSRSHHPQTLGKCERLWKTVGLEFWDRAKPKDLEDAIERFNHYVNHYNHFRPHQGIEGMVPADRFFEMTNEVREAMENSFSKNELKFALDGRPKKPFYFVGQVGDQKISMHGEKGKVIFKTSEGKQEDLHYEELGRTTKGYREEREKVDQTQEEQLQNGCETGDTSERIMEPSEFGAERISSQTSDGNNRLLDRNENEEGDLRDSGRDNFESLADKSTSSVGDVCRSFETTENEEEYDYERRRSEIPEKEDQRTREDYRDTRPSHNDSEIDARMQGSWSEEYDNEEEYYVEDEGSETWQEAEEDTTWNSRLKSDDGYWKKDDE